jgi:hypothetical protein
MNKLDEAKERQRCQDWNRKVHPDDRMTFNEWLSEMGYQIEDDENEIYENY